MVITWKFLYKSLPLVYDKYMASVKDKLLDPRLLPFIDAYIDALFAGEKKPEKSACLALKTDYEGQLRKPGVREEISKRVNDYLSLADIDKIQVLLELKKSAFSSISDVISLKDGLLSVKDFAQIDKDALDSIQSIKKNSFGEIEVKMYSKVDSLKELGSIFGMKTATVNVNHGLQKPGLFDLFDPNEADEDESAINAPIEELEAVILEASETPE